MNIEHYPYRFVKKNVEAWQGLDTFMTHRLLYSFKSTKTNHTYWVWVEVYQHRKWWWKIIEKIIYGLNTILIKTMKIKIVRANKGKLDWECDW